MGTYIPTSVGYVTALRAVLANVKILLRPTALVDFDSAAWNVDSKWNLIGRMLCCVQKETSN